MMPDESELTPRSKFSAEIIVERLRTMTAWLEQADAFNGELDWLGDAEKHPDGSDERRLAGVRDTVDDALARFFRVVSMIKRIRAENTRWQDLLVDAALGRQGDGPDALHLMRRYHALFGDESDADGEVTDHTLPDYFAWDTYLRVSALAELVEKFPKHLRHGARNMHGWPMIVSNHLDCIPEFHRIAERLGIGADYSLDARPRKKRGTETPLLRYLEPLVWRLHVLRKILIETEEKRKGEEFVRRIYGFWWQFPDPEPEPEELAILKLVPSLPPLTQKTAREWSRKAIVPHIMLKDAGTLEACQVPALRNIWQHQSVKSRATFRSRLHSAVTDTLKRFGRPG